ncbi:LexA/Signal peptidase [Aulographum hederae CBS 113979]|uniref:LexA/Signal peptidase n=1 Tax=Aulographum hederae CBS 113979 TaxID=1176131 RepID=A0A6G1GQ79_9PEZI|nr:LexA/Signal peptidase [Aulographum hederae CBS 113979]
MTSLFSRLLHSRASRQIGASALVSIPTIVYTHTIFSYGYSIKPTMGVSMLPILDHNLSVVVISKRSRRGRDVLVGDVVSFHNPVMVGQRAVKRVVGMPGDFVLRDTPEKGEGVMLQVPEGHCFVAGDNQAFSRDSRMFGPIPLALITGKIVATLLPLRLAGRMENGLKEVVGYSDED